MKNQLVVAVFLLFLVAMVKFLPAAIEKVLGEKTPLPNGYSVPVPISHFTDKTTSQWLRVLENRGVRLYPVESYLLQYGVETLKYPAVSDDTYKRYEHWFKLVERGSYLGLYTPIVSESERIRGERKVFLPRDVYRAVVLHEYLHALIDEVSPNVLVFGRSVDRYTIENFVHDRTSSFNKLFDDWKGSILRRVGGDGDRREISKRYYVLEKALKDHMLASVIQHREISQEELAIDGFLFMNADSLGLTPAERHDIYFALRFQIGLMEEVADKVLHDLAALHDSMQIYASVGCNESEFDNIGSAQGHTRLAVTKELVKNTRMLGRFVKNLEKHTSTLNPLHLGDLNHDGKITPSDKDRILKLISDPSEHPWITELVADINSDEEVNADDLDDFYKQMLAIKPATYPWPAVGNITASR